MTPVNVNLQQLIQQIDKDLANGDALAKVSEAQQRARTLSDIGDQLIDHYISQARAVGTSWSQLGEALGVSKQAAQQRWTPAAFSRFTDRARQAIVNAQEQARTLRHDYIGTEHVLLGVLDVEQGAAAQVVVELAGPLATVKQKIVESLEPGAEQSPAKIAFTPLGKQMLAQTLEEALGLGHNYIGTEHLLLGLIQVPEGKAAQLLAGLGVTYEVTQAKVIEWLSNHIATVEGATGAEEAGA
jgi:hypothetical protein